MQKGKANSIQLHSPSKIKDKDRKETQFCPHSQTNKEDKTTLTPTHTIEQTNVLRNLYLTQNKKVLKKHTINLQERNEGTSSPHFRDVMKR